LANDPALRDYLDDIYHTASYFAGYVLPEVEGNLAVKGDVAAEQNHSSVSSDLGNGNVWKFSEHITELCARQQQMIRGQMDRDIRLQITLHSYKSPEIGQRRLDDEAAKRVLSECAFDSLYKRSISAGARLQFAEGADGSIVVWPLREALEETEESNRIKIPRGGCCPCYRGVAFMHQCKHEYCCAGKLLLEKYSNRWFSRTAYEERIGFNIPIAIANILTTSTSQGF
jgi:hypothetical protein